MTKRIFCILVAALAPLAAAAEAATAPAVVVPASDPRIQCIGRFDVSDPKAPRFAWSGSIVQVRCQAEKVTLLLKDDPPANRSDDSGAPFRNWFDVLIDGRLAGGRPSASAGRGRRRASRSPARIWRRS